MGFLREDLHGFKPYVVEDNIYKYKLDANESPFHLPEDAAKGFLEWFSNESLNIYPDTNSKLLRSEIASRLNVNASSIVCTVGSDQLIDLTAKAFLSPGDTVIVPAPSFGMYKITALLNHGNVIEIPLIKEKDDFTYNIGEFIETAKNKKVKIIFICNPNNPTGSTVSLKKIEMLLKNVSCPVFVDEAYDEFHGESAVGLVGKHENLLVGRTFSKAYGIAGARIGYGIGSSEIIDCLELVRPPYNVSVLSQVLGLLVLNGTDEISDRVRFLKAERDRMFHALNVNKLTQPFKSGANFIYFESAADVAAIVKQRDILIRSFDSTSDGRFAARVSIGQREANDAFINALEEIK